MADQLLKELGIADGVTLQLNTLGDAPSREAWRQALVGHFRDHGASLSEDSKARLEKNPLRILDSKDPQDRPFVADAPKIDDYLSGEAQEFFGQVTAGLDSAGVAWNRMDSLVRGLDYYRHTAFEFVTDRLGAQGTVLGGGRYDGLIESLGGAHTPAVGWAAGIERLAMLVGGENVDFDPTLVFAVVPDSPAMRSEADRITYHLKANSNDNFYVWSSYRGHGKKLADKAKKDGADAIVFVREVEKPSDTIHVQNVTGAPEEAMSDLFDILFRLPSPYTSASGEG
jgi:histidyl-tRNA synthetase